MAPRCSTVAVPGTRPRARHATPRTREPALPASAPRTTRAASLAAGLAAFNAAPAADAERALRDCLDDRHWARRLTAHRPYPDLDALLAAADEASYDLAPGAVAGALADETAALPPAAGPAERTALRAAHAAYESRFGHAFVLCLDGCSEAERLDRTLAAIRARLGNEPDEERLVAADELRRRARGRLARLLAAGAETGDGPRLPEQKGRNPADRYARHRR
ncbi:2-oxo-4-hydroxy-4-carboxy-5-ureidoimidazoline decarboxylase [Streptomyces synnematoformans]|uniref:Oxo-4-hydroxy-4-carboxy-5-ureidoimidazoline decarboxylase domain-containing protein n=1 Tax=Streptomyces synnematoformans TaxID=415721 RepID=A0ABN2YV61_9ACTN